MALVMMGRGQELMVLVMMERETRTDGSGDDET